MLTPRRTSRAPKSGSAGRGISAALSAARPEALAVVPKHLRDTHYSVAETPGHKGYALSHNDPRCWLEQTHVEGLRPSTLYQSDWRGEAAFEGRADRFWEDITRRPTPKTAP